jgi:hypothetical protein
MEVQAAVMAAKACPRDERVARKKLIDVCKTDPDFATLAFYAVKRGKDVVEGASINLAKEVARVWGNLQYSVIDHGHTSGPSGVFSQIEVQVWDVENNSRYNKRFNVKHFRHTKNGGYEVNDPTQVRDIVGAATAKEVRSGILNFVPKSLINELKLICEATRIQATPENLKAAIDSAVSWFTEHEISTKQLEKFVGKSQADFGLYELDKLRQVAAAVENGVALEEFFEVQEHAQPESRPASRRQPTPDQSLPSPAVEQPSSPASPW